MTGMWHESGGRIAKTTEDLYDKHTLTIPRGMHVVDHLEQSSAPGRDADKLARFDEGSEQKCGGRPKIARDLLFIAGEGMDDYALLEIESWS
jgi:hypothetical protein